MENTDKIKNGKNDAPSNEESMNIKEDEEDFYDDEMNDGNGKTFFKILLLIFGIVLIVVISIFLFKYFNRV